jgi:hypothetical protein
MRSLENLRGLIDHGELIQNIRIHYGGLPPIGTFSS